MSILKADKIENADDEHLLLTFKMSAEDFEKYGDSFSLESVKHLEEQFLKISSLQSQLQDIKKEKDELITIINEGTPETVFLREKTEGLTDQLREAREVIEFYGDKKRWEIKLLKEKTIGGRNWKSKMMNEMGSKARAYLAKTKGEE